MRSILFLTVAAGCLWHGVAVAAPQPKAEPKDDPYILMELFGATFSVIKDNYVEDTDNRKLVEAAIDGMLASLDPHSGFMNQETFDDMETQTKGEFGGLGLEISSDKGLVRVVSPIDDTPAYQAGIQAGDTITHIDGTTVIGMSLTDAVKRMRGQPKTKVKLTISRADKKPFDITLKRAVIKVKPVKYEAKGDIGYLRVVSFSEKTTDMLRKAIADLTKKIGKDKIKGFVLDVRNNPGGLLDQAVGVADAFLTEGEIVSTRSRDPAETTRYSAQKGDDTNGLPLVVLINEGSASASEIVAGALQDQRRALIVGLKSFGKGSVQTIKNIPEFGAIKITTARYYTPSGNSIQAKGITPDVIVPRAKLEELPVITGFGENILPRAISSEVGKKASDTARRADEKTDKVDAELTEDDKRDYQLERAIDLLHGLSWSQTNRGTK